VRADWQHLSFATVPATAAAAFPLVVAGVVAVGLLVALLCAATSRDLYDRIGRGGLFSGGAPPADDGGSVAERDEEVRQLLGARRDRRARRAAGAPADGPAAPRAAETAAAGAPGDGPPAPRAEEPAAAMAATAPEQPPPATDPRLGAAPGLVEELRQLVVARNVRRGRRGLEPLDVEAEVARRLREL
jgi:hypothetical protein